MNWVLALLIGIILGPIVAVSLVFVAFVGMLLWRSRRTRAYGGMTQAG